MSTEWTNVTRTGVVRTYETLEVSDGGADLETVSGTAIKVNKNYTVNTSSYTEEPVS